ncbi:hypothetical protein ANSO36C_55280 [Nostoc cf. commune SO-36]|uniref:MOSC domain-containing protein n=1 Tax=Nostoc cf. commune SO-36 TaxID=449208 RepID=A0ABM7Z926_NOSCO|nr:MOSC domain-containing protein [Nostoc commune]BDI19726.1 hypothetical protein ANSO36C_55280 [Nostoc cf. commune SO-36]
MVRLLNLDGDGQADLTVHGGADKAVYIYPFEHYDYWRGELPDTELPLGIFGENFRLFVPFSDVDLKVSYLSKLP